MLDKYDIRENKWLIDLFKLKEKWVQSYVKRTFTVGIRVVHGSGRLGFGPDSNSTRLDRVIKNLTRNRPNNGPDSAIWVNR